MNIRDYKVKANYQQVNNQIMAESDAAADEFFTKMEGFQVNPDMDVNIFYDTFSNYACKTNLHLETFLDYVKYWYDRFACYEKLFSQDAEALTKINKMMHSGEEVFDTYFYMCEGINKVKDQLLEVIGKLKTEKQQGKTPKDNKLNIELENVGNLYLDLVEQMNDFAYNVGGSYIDTCWAVYMADLDIEKAVEDTLQKNKTQNSNSSTEECSRN